jgi:hypothetical protein
VRDGQRELTQLGSVSRGVHKYRDTLRGGRTDFNNPVQAAFEWHRLSCRHVAGEAEYGQGCHSEGASTQRNQTKHGNLHRSAIQGKDIVPGAQTERRGGAGPVRGLLGGKDLTGHFSLIP